MGYLLTAQRKHALCKIFCICVLAYAISAQIPDVSGTANTVITSLSVKDKDPVFQQYMRDVEAANKTLNSRAFKQGTGTFFPNLYTYTVPKGETEWSNFGNVAARCGISQGTLATANGIQSRDESLAGKTLILPAVLDGLFIPEKAETMLEILLQKAHPDYADQEKSQKYVANNRIFWYNSSSRLGAEELAFFLDSTLVLPLSSAVLTSGFGTRKNPFGDGWQVHRGVDLAAPVGTPVFVCKAGTVTYTGFSALYGNHIIVTHSGGMDSLYAHLSVIAVKKGATVKKGDAIGKSGATGNVTGPHLHFEIRVNNTPRDPGELVKGIRQ